VTELRRDPITGRAVLIVPGRNARPSEHSTVAPSASREPDCPFCEGCESKTPAELAVIAPPGREPNSPGWQVRTIPNRFPTVETEVVGSGKLSPVPFPFDAEVVSGHHEVVIETPRHSPQLPYLPLEQAVRVLRMCRDRTRHLLGLEGVGSVTLFENSGPESGGSLWHPHAQLVTLPSLTPAIEEEVRGAARFREQSSVSCAFEEVSRAEASDGRRVVVTTRRFLAFAPFASAVPYELRVVPMAHAPSFANATDPEVEELAALLPSLLRALLAVVPGASYNLVVRSPAAKQVDPDRYHWHLDLYPRLVRPDGFDLGSGLNVNTVPPEVAAELLRAERGAKR
jgi:UDPglucose--hexose-1-phosphate uridylyltransferase